MSRDPGERRGSSTRVAWALSLAVTVLVLALPLLSRALDEPVAVFTRDLFSTAEIPVYTGFASNAGVFLWAGCAGVAITGWCLADGATSRGRFLLAGATLTGIFLVDDFFMVHEWILPRFLGVPEEATLAVYGILVLLWTVAFRGQVRAVGRGVLFAALVLFGLSEVFDLVEPEAVAAWRTWTEESLKLFGIAAWTLFFLKAAVQPPSAQATAASKSESPSGVSSRKVSS
ncbi:MAG: hypothetical protein R3199_01455 [Gemmatimonadota bacterium]|nr:hypothetical protein [Gemmatimonadota bacterium]